MGINELIEDLCNLDKVLGDRKSRDKSATRLLVFLKKQEKESYQNQQRQRWLVFYNY